MRERGITIGRKRDREKEVERVRERGIEKEGLKKERLRERGIEKEGLKKERLRESGIEIKT